MVFYDAVSRRIECIADVCKRPRQHLQRDTGRVQRQITLWLKVAFNLALRRSRGDVDCERHRPVILFIFSPWDMHGAPEELMPVHVKQDPFRLVHLIVFPILLGDFGLCPAP